MKEKIYSKICLKYCEVFWIRIKEKEKNTHEFGHRSNLLPGKKGFAKAVFPDLCSNIGKKINRQGKF